MQRLKSCFGLFCLLLSMFRIESAFALEDPVAMLKNVTTQVIHELKTHRSEIRKNRSKVYKLAERHIVPYVDFAEMGRWVVGRNAWSKTDPQTREAFVHEFKNLVVSSYAGSLLNYTDQQIEYLPLRGGVEDEDRIQVSSVIKESGKAPVHLDYRLIRDGDSWKVYDILVEGVSLAQGYRAQFADDVKDGGVPQVVRTLKEKRKSQSSHHRTQE